MRTEIPPLPQNLSSRNSRIKKAPQRMVFPRAEPIPQGSRPEDEYEKRQCMRAHRNERGPLETQADRAGSGLDAARYLAAPASATRAAGARIRADGVEPGCRPRPSRLHEISRR